MSRKAIIFTVSGILIAGSLAWVVYKRIQKAKAEAEKALEESEEVEASFEEVKEDHKDANGRTEYHKVYDSEFVRKDNAMKDEYLRTHEYTVSYEEKGKDEDHDPAEDEIVTDEEMAEILLDEQRKRDILEDTKPIPGEPHLITQEEYDNSERFDKEGLFYYSNGFLTLDGENNLKEKIQDIAIIGNMMVHELEDQVKRTKGKEKVIYVRNEKLKTDFEVIFVDEIYGAD